MRHAWHMASSQWVQPATAPIVCGLIPAPQDEYTIAELAQVVVELSGSSSKIRCTAPLTAAALPSASRHVVSQTSFPMLHGGGSCSEMSTDLISATMYSFKPAPADDPTQRKPDISLAAEKLNGWKPEVIAC